MLLSPKFVSLRQEERQQMLHEGAGANVMSAFVEVVFDNADGRLAIDGDEVVLRRTIGLKKDEFFLNRKRVTKNEVSSLLEVSRRRRRRRPSKRPFSPPPPAPPTERRLLQVEPVLHRPAGQGEPAVPDEGQRAARPPQGGGRDERVRSVCAAAAAAATPAC